MPATQPDPEVLIGLFSELPNPASVPQGYFYFATDTIQLFMLKINPTTQARAWVLTSSAGSLPGIPFDQVAVGNATGTGLTSSANFTYDPASGLLTARDTTGKILFTLDGNPATRLLSLFNAAGVSVFSYSTVTNTFAHAAPTNPQYFVASTGSNTNPGTLASPLATVAEGLRRLSVSSWSGSAKVFVLDTVNEGNAPVWDITSPPSGALSHPIDIEGTWVTVFSGIATGGSSPSAFLVNPVTLGVVTTGVAMIANQYRGKFLEFTSGALLGRIFPIDSNTAGGNILFTGETAGVAPAAGNTFVIHDAVGKITYTGRFTINNPSALEIAKLEIDCHDQIAITGGVLQTTACRIISTALCDIQFLAGALWYDGQSDSILPFTPINTPVGSRWDGTAGIISPFGGNNLFVTGQDGALVISGASMHAIVVASYAALAAEFSITQHSTFTNGSAVMYGTCELLAITCLFDSCFTVSFGILEVGNGADMSVSNSTITNTAAASDVLYLDFGASAFINRIDGANPLAARGIVAQHGSTVALGSQPALTVGGSPAVVGSNAGTTFANVFAGNAQFSTDVNVASSGVATSQLCRIGP